MRNYYVSGDWNAICDICGFKFKASMLRKNWKGQYVCAHDFETRHPQDLLRVRSDRISVPWTRPEPTDVFISIEDYWTDEHDAPIVSDLEIPLRT